MIEQRKALRFDLKLPFELVRNGSQHTSNVGETTNMSSTGVLFRSDSLLDIGDSIEYMITLPSPPGTELVKLRCMGKVIRKDRSCFGVTLERYEFVRNGK